jgi:multisubunit Na+/H+ antiporter MnhC subunit
MYRWTFCLFRRRALFVLTKTSIIRSQIRTSIFTSAVIILAVLIMGRKSYKTVETGDDSTTVTAPASEVAAPSTFSDGLPLPQVMVFDLDYTLWPFWVDTHVTGPLKPTKDGLVVKDRYNDSYGFYPDVAGILVAVRLRHCRTSMTLG